MGAGFHPDLSGRENVYLNGTILGLSKKEIEQRFDEIVAFSELERFIDTPVKRYSSGMTVRLGFAVAACIEPDILLVDEVLAVGDASFQQKCMQRIQALVDRGTSIIFVSHNLYLVQAICASALYIDHGEIVARGKTIDVIAAYEKALHVQRAENFQQNSDGDQNDLDADFEIAKVEVLGPDLNETTDIRSDQPASIQIHYYAYKDIGPINVSAYIIRSDGVTCCMMRTSLGEFTPRLSQGAGTITVTLLPLQLIGGTYFAEAWFLNQSDSMLLTQKPGRSDWFVVHGNALSFEERSGVYEPKTHWQQQENSYSVKLEMDEE